MTKTIPTRTNAAPKAKSGAGISWNTLIPKIVAPMGSSNANVAVSNDFKFDNEEKYSVWAIAVGSIPKPNMASMASELAGRTGIPLVTGTLRIPTTIAVNRYIGAMMERMSIWLLSFLP